MMFGVQGAEKVGGGLVPGFVLLAAPMHEQTVAEAAQHPYHPHGAGLAHPALIIVMGDVQALVQAVFNAPGGAIGLQPLRRVQCLRRQARHQRHDFRPVLAQVAAH